MCIRDSVKGTDQPAATGGLSSYDGLSESYAFPPDVLDDVDTAYLISDDETEEYSYTVTGWSRNESHLVFHTSRGDKITVDTVGNLVTHDDAGNVLLEREGEHGRKMLSRRSSGQLIRRMARKPLGGNGFGGLGFGSGNFQGNH